MTKIGSSRLGGAALIAGSLLLITGGFFHPRGEASGTDAFASLIVDNILVWYSVHTMLLLAPPILILGFFTLFRTLMERGERIYSLPATLSLGLGATLLTVGVVFDGFVSPIVAQAFLEASAPQAEVAAFILDYNNLVYLSLLAPSLFLLLLGGTLLGLSLVRAKLYNKWLAWAGVAIALVGVIAYIAGLFGPYWVGSPLFAPYISLFLLWILVLGASAWIPKQENRSSPESDV